MHAFRIVNVFTIDGDKFSGNPLCVFEDARGLSGEQMQALARQMNLSETTFVLPSEKADAHVRIFTPGFEMPFAGHPTLGTAFVIGAGRDVALEMIAGRVSVTARGNELTLRAAQAISWLRSPVMRIESICHMARSTARAVASCSGQNEPQSPCRSSRKRRSSEADAWGGVVMTRGA